MVQNELTHNISTFRVSFSFAFPPHSFLATLKERHAPFVPPSPLSFLSLFGEIETGGDPAGSHILQRPGLGIYALLFVHALRLQVKGAACLPALARDGSLLTARRQYGRPLTVNRHLIVAYNPICLSCSSACIRKQSCVLLYCPFFAKLGSIDRLCSPPLPTHAFRPSPFYCFALRCTYISMLPAFTSPVHFEQRLTSVFKIHLYTSWSSS